MKNLYFFFFVLFISGTSFAQTQVSAEVNAEIIAPLVLKYDGVPLDFGKFTAPQTGTETVVVTANGDFRQFSDGSMEIPSFGTFSAASFSVERDTNISYSISTAVIDNPTELGGDAMTIDKLTVSTGRTGVTESTFSIGGTLSVNAGTNSGVYEGKVDVTVAYE